MSGRYILFFQKFLKSGVFAQKCVHFFVFILEVLGYGDKTVTGIYQKVLRVNSNRLLTKAGGSKGPHGRKNEIVNKTIAKFS